MSLETILLRNLTPEEITLTTPGWPELTTPAWIKERDNPWMAGIRKNWAYLIACWLFQLTQLLLEDLKLLLVGQELLNNRYGTTLPRYAYRFPYFGAASYGSRSQNMANHLWMMLLVVLLLLEEMELVV